MLIYLASPYSHPDEAVRARRFWDVCDAAAKLMREGHQVFSPIAHSHPIALCGELPTDWEYWRDYDEAMLAASSELWVLMLDGWRDSVGIKAEVAIAERLGLPVHYVHHQCMANSRSKSARFARA